MFAGMLGILVGVSVISVMMLEIIIPLSLSVYEYQSVECASTSPVGKHVVCR